MSSLVRRLAGGDRSLAGGMALVALYALLRMLGAPEWVVYGWAAVAAVASLFSPLAGLTMLAAIGPFTEALTAEGRITPAPILVASTALGAGVRFALWRKIRQTPPAVIVALIMAAGTLAAVVLSGVAFGQQAGVDALQLWVVGIGAGLGVLLVGWWVARSGEIRPLLVAIVSVTAAAVVSLADFVSGGALAAGPLAWLIRPLAGAERLSGIIPAPNAAATIFIGALAVTAGALVLARTRLLQLLALPASAVLLAAVLLTLSRSALLALVVVALLLAWRRWRWPGLVAAIGALSVALLVANLAGLGLVRLVPAIADEARLDAWVASARMWLAAPLTGHGLRSFEWLHVNFGSTLDAPHNEWLRLFAEGGIVLGVIALAFVGATLASLLRAQSWVAYVSGAAAACLVVMASFNNPFLYIQVNVPAFLIIGSGLGLLNAPAARRAPESSAAGS